MGREWSEKQEHTEASSERWPLTCRLPSPQRSDQRGQTTEREVNSQQQPNKEKSVTSWTELNVPNEHSPKPTHATELGGVASGHLSPTTPGEPIEEVTLSCPSSDGWGETGPWIPTELKLEGFKYYYTDAESHGGWSCPTQPLRVELPGLWLCVTSQKRDQRWMISPFSAELGKNRATSSTLSTQNSGGHTRHPAQAKKINSSCRPRGQRPYDESK